MVIFRYGIALQPGTEALLSDFCVSCDTWLAVFSSGGVVPFSCYFGGISIMPGEKKGGLPHIAGEAAILF